MRNRIFLLCCFGCGFALAGQVPGRTTKGAPVSLTLENTPQGIQFQAAQGLTPTTAPGPKTPLEVTFSGKTTGINLAVSGASGGSPRELCSGSGTCAVAVRYKVGSAQRSLYLVRAGTKLLVTSPDTFIKTGSGALLRHASMTQIEELGGNSIPASAGTKVFATFEYQ